MLRIWIRWIYRRDYDRNAEYEKAKETPIHIRIHQMRKNTEGEPWTKKKTPFYTQNKTRFDKYLSARKSLYGIIDLFANIAMVRRGARMSNAHVLLHTQRTQEDCVQNHSKIFLPFFAHTKKKRFFCVH